METVFSQKNFLQYLTTFDSTLLKYFFQLPDPKPDPKDSFKKLDGERPDHDLLERIRKYEETYRQNTLDRRDYGKIADRQLLVFGNGDTVSENIQIFELVRKKILEEYLAVPNLEELYSERYFDFEWDMLLGRNFSEVKHDYYRDHFIHQVRNLFMMFELLKHHGFYQSLVDTLSNHTQAPISRYFRQMRDRCVESILSVPGSEKYCLITEVSSQEPEIAVRDYVRDYVTHYAIYAATVMAALFHDIGYPVRHYLSLRSRLAEYIPSLYMLGLDSDESFERLFSILGQSLLLRMTPQSQVRTRLQINKKGDYDHGAYSAVIFLASLYDNGSIYDLNGEQRLAVELAAVMIYDHTKKYKALDAGDPWAWDQRELFHVSPLSFLFRVCDDLQEWERIYYEISDFGEMVTCPKCNMPIVWQHNEDAKDKDAKDKDAKDKDAKDKDAKDKDAKDDIFGVCGCDLHTTHPILNSHISDARGIYSVNTCKYVSVKDEDEKQGGLEIRLNYDLEKLMHMSVISSTYAKYRLSELNKLKVYMDSQSIPGIPYIKLLYFITSNPIACKIAIMQKLCETAPGFSWAGVIKAGPKPSKPLRLFYNEDPDSQIPTKIRKVVRLAKKNVRHDYSLSFYLLCALYIQEKVGEKMIHFNDPFLLACFDSMQLTNASELKELLEDAFRDVHSYLRINQGQEIDYFKQYEAPDNSGDRILHLIDVYCNPRYAYTSNTRLDVRYTLDYYSDLNHFHKIWTALR